MKQVYFPHGGQILVHNVVLETKDNFYIDRIETSTSAIVPLSKELVGVQAHETFEEAKEARLEAIKKAQEKLEEEAASINEQEEAVDGQSIDE